MAATVIAPGARTLVQDLGRFGHGHLGVPASGAADLDSLRLANRLVGNADGAAALEILLTGPTLTFDTDVTVAIAGAPSSLAVDGCPAPHGHTLRLRAGQVLTVGPVLAGLRSYLAVGGGFTVPMVLGSRSACTLSGLGPATLTAGVVLETGPDFDGPLLASSRPLATSQMLRVMAGPHTDLFDAAALTAFFGTRWAVSPMSSRVGVRLDGPCLAAPAVNLPSLGMVTGAVQVPPNGQPIVLGPDHGTTGGYPVIATVISADLPTLAQFRPGAPVRFSVVNAEQARQALKESRDRLERAVVNLAAISR